MTTPRKPPRQAESLLDGDLTPTGARRKIGRVERRVYAAIRAARERGAIDDLEDPLAAAALDLARMIDRASAEPGVKSVYAVVSATGELRKCLEALSFTQPRSAGTEGSGALERFLEGMSEPEQVDE